MRLAEVEAASPTAVALDGARCAKLAADAVDEPARRSTVPVVAAVADPDPLAEPRPPAGA